MCLPRTLLLTLFVLLGFTSLAQAKQQLELSDDGLPVQELRPMDRRVYTLTLDGKWEGQASPKTTYYVNFFFRDGGSYSHKVDDVPQFRKGDVRCILQSYQLTRHGIANGGKFSIAVSAGGPVTSADAPEVISNVKEFTWPLERQLTRFRVQTKHSPPEPVDAFPIPGEETARPPAKPPVKPKPKSP